MKGYKAISVIKLINATSAYRRGAISFKALRVYIACLELVAIREAARRSLSVKTKKTKSWVCYEKKELIRLTDGLSLRSIGKALKELERASVMKFSKSAITFTDIPICSAKEILEANLGGRRGTRAVPVPRKMLKMLSKLSKPTVFLTTIAYAIRGLSMNKNILNTRGTVKASWIVDTFGISVRGVRSARAELVEMGLISRDVNSYQRKLNRDGAYFELNINIFNSDISSRDIFSASKSAELCKTVKTRSKDSSFMPKTAFAPPKAKNRTTFAPPKEKLKTSKENKNHKTHAQGSDPALRAKSGFSIEKFSKKDSFNKKINNKTLDKNKIKHTKKIRKSNLKDIQLEDLKRVSSVINLYEQAILAGWLQRSRANQLNCIAAALRASVVNAKNPAGVFVRIIKNQLWNYITQAQEDRAVVALKRYEKRDLSLIKNYQRKEKEPISFCKDKAFTGLKAQAVSSSQEELNSMILGILEKTQPKAVA